MTTVTVATTFTVPVERVFEVFTDLEHAAERVSNIQKIEVLTTGGFQLGTRWLETREVLTQLDTAEMEVTAFVHNRTYTITHHKAGTRIDTVFTFAPFGDGTRVLIEFGLEAHGLPPGLLAPLGWAIAGKVRDVISRDLADLKTSLEARPDAGRPLDGRHSARRAAPGAMFSSRGREEDGHGLHPLLSRRLQRARLREGRCRLALGGGGGLRTGHACATPIASIWPPAACWSFPEGRRAIGRRTHTGISTSAVLKGS